MSKLIKKGFETETDEEDNPTLKIETQPKIELPNTFELPLSFFDAPKISEPILPFTATNIVVEDCGSLFNPPIKKGKKKRKEKLEETEVALLDTYKNTQEKLEERLNTYINDLETLKSNQIKYETDLKTFYEINTALNNKMKEILELEKKLTKDQEDLNDYQNLLNECHTDLNTKQDELNKHQLEIKEILKEDLSNKKSTPCKKDLLELVTEWKKCNLNDVVDKIYGYASAEELCSFYHHFQQFNLLAKKYKHKSNSKTTKPKKKWIGHVLMGTLVSCTLSIAVYTLLLN